MWTLEQLDVIRDECIEDVLQVFPYMNGRIVKPYIEMNHKTTSTLARYSKGSIQFSAFLFAKSTKDTFFRTAIMKGLILGQVSKNMPEISTEMAMALIESSFPDKYDFDGFKECRDTNPDIPKNMQQEYKYAITCPQCGEVYRYKRMCKSVLYPEIYYCNKCNVSLKRIK